MKKFIIAMLFTFLWSTLDVKASVESGYVSFEKNITIAECVELSRTARRDFVEDDFGEVVDEDSYNYITENLKINVLCIEKKQLVVVFVSAQDLNPYKYLRIFEKHFDKK